MIFGQIQENAIRMKTAATIVIGDHNNEKRFIEHNSRVFWNNLKAKWWTSNAQEWRLKH